MRHDLQAKFDNVEIDFVTSSYQEILAAKSNAGKRKTIFSFRSSYRFNNHIKIAEVRSTQDIKDNKDGAGDASSIDSKMEINYRRLHAKINAYMRDNDVKPSEAISKVIGDLNKSFATCLDLQISSAGDVEGNRGTLYFRKKDHPSEFEFNVLSSGEKEVIDVLLDLYLRKDDYDDTVFLLDEPELHINTSIQSNLLTEIDNLVGKNCQIWLTTHSIGFLRALQTHMKDKCQIIQCERPPAISRWLRSTAQAGYSRPGADQPESHNFEVVIRLLRLLVLDVFLPYLVGNVTARGNPVASAPQVLPPIPLLQRTKFAQQPVRALSFQKLYGSGHRHIRRYRHEHMHVVPIDRPGVDRHFQTPCDLPQELSGPQPDIPYQDWVPVLRNPHQVVLAVPNRMAAALVVLHRSDDISSRPSRRLKARDLRIPYGGL